MTFDRFRKEARRRRVGCQTLMTEALAEHIRKDQQGCEQGGGRIRRSQHLKDNAAMAGIQFVTDEKGHTVAVQIDLTRHRELREDIADVLVSRSRRHDKRIPLEKVKVGLIRSGKLSRE